MPQLRHWRAIVLLAIGVAVGAIGGVFCPAPFAQRSCRDAAIVAGIDVYPVFVDSPPVQVITTANWVKEPIVTTRDAVKSDHTLWRRMHFEDMGQLPHDLMEVGLTNLLNGTEPSLTIHWRGREWTCGLGSIPEPARAMAFLNIIKYWDNRYQVGRRHGLNRRLVTDTLQAVAMSSPGSSIGRLT